MTIAAVCFAGCLLKALRSTRLEVAELQAQAADGQARLRDVEEQVAVASQLHRSTATRIDSLLIRQARLEKSTDAHAYDDAINLSRRGADERELETSCGLSLGEARLIRTLYGATSDAESQN
jgi:hypothetical protein